MPTVPTADLRIAVMRLARRLRSERADDALTPSQLAVLGTLFRRGPLSTRDLAASERVRPPSMTRILNSLREAGLVVGETDPQDARMTLYRATDPARALVMADRQRRDRWLADRLAELSPSEREILAAAVPVLTRLALD